MEKLNEDFYADYLDYEKELVNVKNLTEIDYSKFGFIKEKDNHSFTHSLSPVRVIVINDDLAIFQLMDYNYKRVLETEIIISKDQMKNKIQKYSRRRGWIKL
jgi:hypothetical protein